MKTISSVRREQVIRVLKSLGLSPQGRGNGSSHQIWKDARGLHCRPKLIEKEINIGALYALGSSLENRGICDRRDFMHQVMGKALA